MGMKELKRTNITECNKGTLLHYENGKPAGILISKEYVELERGGWPHWLWMLSILSTEGTYFDIGLGEHDLFF